jgi:hypothetical protein
MKFPRCPASVKTWLMYTALVLTLGDGLARGATLTVTSTADDGPGSLRKAISDAAPNDLIVFDPALDGQTISLTSGELLIARNLTIRGLGADRLTINANGLSRVFNVDTTVATLSDLTITGGFVGGTDPLTPGGGGIVNFANLTLQRCHITGNHAEFHGGGIASYLDLVIDACTISSNTAHSSIFRLSPTTAGDARGGGIYGAATVVCVNSTITRNLAFHDGGLFNIVPSGRGGGVYLEGTGSPRFESCTIVSNSIVLVPRPNLGAADGLAWGGGINIQNAEMTTTLRNCILAGNTLSPSSIPCGPDVGCGGLVSLGHNVVGNGQPGISGNVVGDKVGTGQNPIDPRLSPLKDNLGPTPTHALLKHSPAVNAGENAGASVADQRGEPRIVGGTIDAGAVEKAPRITQCATNITLCNTPGQCTGATAFGQPTFVGDDPTEILGFHYSRFPNVPLPIGTTPVTCTVVDSDGLTDTCVFQVVVKDCDAPVIQSQVATPSVLSPANNQLIPVTITVSGTDCTLPITSRVRRVIANQTLAAGDVEITGPLTLKLKARTSSPFQTRIYTIDVTHSDAAGNRINRTTTVSVPPF